MLAVEMKIKVTHHNNPPPPLSVTERVEKAKQIRQNLTSSHIPVIIPDVETPSFLQSQKKQLYNIMKKTPAENQQNSPTL